MRSGGRRRRLSSHTQIVYGPLLNGVTSVIFEGLPTYPSPARIWQEVERLKVGKSVRGEVAVWARLSACRSQKCTPRRQPFAVSSRPNCFF